MKIQAAVLRGASDPYAIEPVELAPPGPGQVLVRIVGAGFCHTDMLPRTPGFMAQPPIITGHEGAGIVEEVGPGVTGIAPGAHVVLSFDSCGACQNCLGGHPAYCENFYRLNLTGSGLDGVGPATDHHGQPVAARWFGQSSFATYALATARNIVEVDKDLPLELLGPLGCGIQTGAGSVLLALRAGAGSSVVVFGAGGVGLSAIMAARVARATTIVAVDLHESRLSLARELGATATVHGGDDNIVAQLRKLTGGGTQYALDTTGIPSVINTAIEALRPTGTVGLVGVQSRPLTLPPSALAQGKNVRGILEGDAVPQLFIPQLLELWQQGRFPFDRLVRTYPLSAINDAERDSVAGTTIKPVLLPGS
ncbi:NAD(P)-dependent alcohol dehydrogenase [Streptomyces olivochromogenes]|uniref:NAD(P)-dependent alcohol dehydrogenase n=1 Tax=Streptomyces olivochromogenes TaxID=1963 RepID=UPI001F481893|nr:NAD(P)-dependent alcohol dehydrogenase [Streptomyces olivochromogenes]MCF3131720.1 NAD(P)-dependent alcohol dehydrogenase [Streptomyces olivochromogenes]